jgi:hypothetical protein
VIPYRYEQIADPLAKHVGHQQCRRSSARKVANVSTYAITLCDVTQKHFEVVLIGEEIFVRDHDESFFFYAVISITTIIIVTSVAQNIAHLLGDVDAVTNFWLEIVSALVLATTCLFNTNFVTHEDVFYFIVVSLYVFLNIFHWIFFTGVPINALLATLMLLLARLYNGIESDYVAPIMFLFIVRAFEKALNKKDSKAEKVVLVADFFLVGLTHQYGFLPLFEKRLHANTYFAVMIFFAYQLALYLRQKFSPSSNRIHHDKSDFDASLLRPARKLLNLETNGVRFFS